MKFENTFFIIGTAYAGKSTMVKMLAERYNGIACEENYHNALLPELAKEEFPNLTYTRDLQDWHDFIRRRRMNMKNGSTAHPKKAKYWNYKFWAD